MVYNIYIAKDNMKGRVAYIWLFQNMKYIILMILMKK